MTASPEAAFKQRMKDVVGDMEYAIADTRAALLVLTRLMEHELRPSAIGDGTKIVLLPWQADMLVFAATQARTLADTVEEQWDKANDEVWGRVS